MINATRITWLNGALNEGELIKVKVIVKKNSCIYINIICINYININILYLYKVYYI